MPTNVPPIVFGPNGPVAPSEPDILVGLQADWNAAFQTEFDFGTTGGSGTNATPQGQITTSEAAIVGNAYGSYVALANQFDPAFAKGRYQDALARAYNLTRIPAQPTTLQISCSGLTGVIIPADGSAQIKDSTGNLYACTTAGTIPVGGNVTLTFAALIPGTTPVPPSVSIYRAITGWDSATLVSGVQGNDTESRSQFETRRQQTLAANAAGTLPAVLGAVLKVSGVVDAYVTENDSGAPVLINGFTLAAKSIYVAASGGTDAAVAQAAWSKKAPGCAWNGNTSVVVQDTSAGYSPPYPSYTVLFERPTALQFLFAVNILNSSLVPSDATMQIQNAIVAAFAGGDGGPRARIGATVLATRFYAPIIALGAWAQIISIQVGSGNTEAANFTGVIVATTLTVSAVTGSVAIGQTVLGAGVAPGTTITAGSGTTWTVSISQTIGSEAMQSALANQNDVVVHIDQVPAIDANNIKVTLT